MEHGQIETELRRLHPETFGWALACCDRNRSDAEDVMQQVYVKVLEGSARFEGQSGFRTWLFGVVRNTAAERRRRHAIRNRLLKGLFLGRVTAENPGPENRIDYTARSKKLLEAISGLSRRQSEVLQLALYHEMTLEQVATVTGLSIGSTRTHYARGKKNLKRMLLETGQQGAGHE